MAHRDRLGLVSSALAEALGDRVEISRPEGRLQLAARLHELADNGPLRAALNAAGFAVSSLSDYFFDRTEQGLDIGFSDSTARDARRFSEVLRRHLDTSNGGRA